MFIASSRWQRLKFLPVFVFFSLSVGLIRPPKTSAMLIYPNQVLDYPQWKMPCEHRPYFIWGYCANYDWGPFHTEAYDHWSEISERGYAFRNCTDYVAWRMTTIGVTIPYNLGNAADWWHNTPLKRRAIRAKAGDIAFRPGGYGHVAYVERVKSVDPENPMNDVIAISEYNYFGTGTGSVRVGGAGRLGFTNFIDYGVHSD